MAYTRRSGGTSSSQDALLQELLVKYKQESMPKVGWLGRLLAPLVGIGSGIDAYYDARFQDKDAGIGNILSNYGQNLLGGFSTLATGRQSEDAIQGASELLDKTNPRWKYGLGKNKIARMGVDIAAGLVTDPLTYVSFGSTALGKSLATQGVKAISKAGIKKTLAKELSEQLAQETLEGATKRVASEFGQEAADRFFSKVSLMGGEKLKSGAVKVLGKKVSENPLVVKGAKAFANPFGLIGEGVATGLQKAAPEMTYNIRKMFDPVGAVAAEGRTELASDLLNFQREGLSAERKALAELVDSGVVSAYKGLDTASQKNAGRIIEASRRVTPEVEVAEAIAKQRQPMIDFLKDWVKKNTFETASTDTAPFSKAQYHGTFNPLGKFVPGEDIYSPGNIYGQGLYTTSSIDIAKGYAKPRSKGVLDSLLKKGEEVTEQDGNIYKIKPKAGAKLLDMEKPMTKDVREIVDGVLGGFEGEASYKGKTLRNIYDEIRGFDESADQIQYYFTDLQQRLMDRGYGGLTHIGGKLTNNKPHTVKIFWNPAEQVDVISPLKNEVAEREFLTGLSEIYPDFKNVNEELQAVLATKFGPKSRYVLDTLTEKVDKLAKSGNATDEAIGSVVDEMTGLLNKKALKQAERVSNTIKGGQEELFPRVVSDIFPLKSDTKGFIDKYFDFQRGRAAQLEKAGFPTISEFDMGYVGRNSNIAGFRPEFLKSYLKQRTTPGTVESILSNKKVLKELEKNDGVVSKGTIDKLLVKENKGALSAFEQGELSSLLGGKGATEERLFKSIQQAEAAGVVFKDQWIDSLYKQTIRQNEQLRAKEFVDTLIETVDDKGTKLFKEAPEGAAVEAITIPGAEAGKAGKVLYTDRITRDVTQNILNTFTKTDDLESVLKTFDKTLGWWKQWVTGKGPNFVSYNIRNATDDLFRMVIDGHDLKSLPSDIKMGADLIRYDDLVMKVGRKEAQKQIQSTAIDDFYKKMGIKAASPIDDLWGRTTRNGVLADVTRFKSDVGEEGASTVARAQGEIVNSGDRINRVVTIGGLTNKRESAFRVAHFLDGWRKTGSTTGGVEATKRTLFNYSELTDVEKGVFRRLVPFYAFAKNNSMFYLNKFANRPEQMSKFSNVYEGIKSGGRDENTENLPSYLQNELAINLGAKDDKLSLLSNIGLSAEALNSPVMGNINPILKMIIEMQTGKNTFRGTDIADDNYAGGYTKYPEPLKKLLGVTEYEQTSKSGEITQRATMPPTTKYLLDNAPFISNLFTSADKLFGAETPIETLTKLLIPVKIESRSIKDDKSRREREKYDELYKLLQGKGLADTYEKFYIPSGLKDILTK